MENHPLFIDAPLFHHYIRFVRQLIIIFIAGEHAKHNSIDSLIHTGQCFKYGHSRVYIIRNCEGNFNNLRTTSPF